MPKLKQFKSVEELKKELKEEVKAEAEAEEKRVEAPKVKLDIAVENVQIPAKRWPDIRCGVCEFCGVMCTDPNKGDTTAWHQYRNCPHYKGVDVRCIYCPIGEDMEDIIKARTIKVRERTDANGNGTGVLTMWCTDMKCENAHWKRIGATQRPL